MGKMNRHYVWHGFYLFVSTLLFIGALLWNAPTPSFAEPGGSNSPTGTVSAPVSAISAFFAGPRVDMGALISGYTGASASVNSFTITAPSGSPVECTTLGGSLSSVSAGENPGDNTWEYMVTCSGLNITPQGEYDVNVTFSVEYASYDSENSMDPWSYGIQTPLVNFNFTIADESAPGYVSGTIDGGTGSLTFNETLKSATCPKDSFEIIIDGVGSGLFALCSISGTDVNFSIAGGVSPGQVVTVNYTGESNETSNRIEDVAGNITGNFFSASVENVSLDQTQTPGVLDLSSDYDSGVSNTDDITSSTGFVLSGGDLEEGATVNLYQNGSLVESNISSESGQWSTMVSGLSEGTYLFKVKSTAPGKSESAFSPTLTVRIYTSAPVLQSATINGNTLTLLWDHLMDNPGSLEGDIVLEGGGCGYAGTPTINNGTPTASQATIVIQLTCTAQFGESYVISYVQGVFRDLAENDAVAASGVAVTNETPNITDAPSTPDLDSGSDTGSSSTDDNTSDTTPTFTGTSAANATVRLYRSGAILLGTATANGSGGWSITSSALSAATYSIYATAQSSGETVSSASGMLSVIIDTTVSAPTTLDLIEAADGGLSSTDNLTSSTSPAISMSCETGATVSLKEGGTTLGTGTCSSSTVTISSSTLSDGAHVLKATQTDLAGNISSDSSTLTITIDTTAPTVTLTSVSDTTVTEAFDVTLTASEGITGLLAGDFTVVNGSLSALATVSTSTYTFTITPSAAGTVTVKLNGVTVTDDAANDNAQSNTLSRTYSVPENNGGGGGNNEEDDEVTPTPNPPGAVVVAPIPPSTQPGQSPTNPPSNTPTSTPSTFLRDLSIAMNNIDVFRLQEFLAGKGLFKVSPTGYFGRITQAALVKYQKQRGITPSDGLFGILTRLFVNFEIKNNR
jgi:hypothetical protein